MEKIIQEQMSKVDAMLEIQIKQEAQSQGVAMATQFTSSLIRAGKLSSADVITQVFNELSLSLTQNREDALRSLVNTSKENSSVGNIRVDPSLATA